MNGEVSGNDPASAGDGRLHFGRRNDLAVQNDRQTTADVFTRRTAEPFAAESVEAEIDDGFPFLKIRTRIGQMFAADNGFAFNDIIGLSRSLVPRNDFGFWRNLAAARIRQRRFLIDEMERHLGRFSQQLFNFVRIFNAGELNLNAIRPLTHDGRFAGSQLVDTATHDFNRFVNGRRLHAGQRKVCKRNGQLVILVFDFQIALVDLLDQVFGFQNVAVVHDADF